MQGHRRCNLVTSALLLHLVTITFAQTDSPTLQAEQEEQAVTDDTDSPAPAAPREYYISKSPSTDRKGGDRPPYVKPFSEISGDSEMSWLDFGLSQRTRFEFRDDSYRDGQETDEFFFLRSRLYLGVREVLDPFRFSLELQDSRRFGMEFSERSSDVNEADILQAYAELYFEDALGEGLPLSFRAGRMSFNAIDRRLFSRNGFRNTTNAFDGFRLRLGDEHSEWELDTFAFQRVARQFRQFDHPDEQQMLYGINYYWRGWSPHIILEPYYFVLDEDLKDPGTNDQLLHTIGVHGYGQIRGTGFDYDFNLAFQYGDRERGTHKAYAAHVELAYTFEHAWKPRLAAMLNYASGDRDPTDDDNERFNTLAGSSRNFYGHSELFGWQNLVSPGLFLSTKPTEKIKFEAFYRGYWLASGRDGFIRAGIFDPSGDSGNFVGHEIDLFMRYTINKHMDVEIGYVHFMPGSFTRNATSSTDDSDTFYVQTKIKL